MRAPTSESYWFEPGRLLAGKYPGSLEEERARKKVTALVAAGVNTFVDLTEDGELLPYAQMLPPDVRHVRKPIEDLRCATEEQMAETLDLIDEALEDGIVYVHCWGGCGRTGTVLACHLVRHGASHREALERVSAATQTIGWPPGACPQMPEQFEMVRAWRVGR